MNRFLLLLVVLIATSIYAIEKPIWITQHPNDPNFYIGIGNSLIDNKSDYKSQAKSKAFNDIASQIETKIKTDTERRFSEHNSVVDDLITTRIQLSSDIKLENIDFFDSWNDKKEYWVYFRLSKEVYQRIRKEKISSAINLSVGFYDQATNNLNNKLISQAIINLYQAYQSIIPYIGETLPAIVSGKEVLIDQNIYNLLYHIQNNIVIEFSKNNVACKKGINADLKIPTNVFFKTKDNPIMGLPVSFQPINTFGKFTQFAITDKYGNVDFSIKQIYLKSSDFNIEAYVDIDSLLNSVNINGHKTDYPQFISPKSVLKVSTIPITVSFAENITDLNGQRIENSVFKPYIDKSLINLGLQNSDMANSDITITLTGSFVKGKQISGMNSVSTLLNIDFIIIDTLTKQEYFRDKYVNIKGVSSDYISAQGKAIHNFGVLLQDNVFPKQIDNLFNY